MNGLKQEQILLVDDDASILMSQKTFLESKNYAVTTADNGKHAIEIFKASPFLVVITDLQMPEMDGTELINHLLAFKHKPILIVQSVESDMNHVIELLQIGVYDYLLKPSKFIDLHLKVKKAFEE